VFAAFSFQEQRGLEKLKPGELEKIVARGYAHHDDFTPAAQAELVKRGVAIHWQPWSTARVAELRAQGKPVFVDFTASWCAICQQNKASTFHREAVEKAFVAKGVVTLHADFSNEDEVILQELKRFGRAGVPLYLLYGKDPSAPPAVLPNVMSPGIVLDALEKL
jgi:thiol:disulfide interchange protein